MENRAEHQISYPEREKIWTREFLFICIANFFLFLGFQMTLPTLPLFVEELGGNEKWIGIVVGVFTFSALLIRPYAGHALESRGRGFVYYAGLLIFVVSVGSYSLMTALWPVLMMRIIQGIGWGMSTTASGTIATDLIPASRRGEGLGYFGLSGNFALALGPSFGLWLAERISFHWLFFICAFLGFLAFVLSWRIRLKKGDGHTQTVFFRDLYEKSALQPAILMFFITATFGGIATFLPLFTAERGVWGIHWYFIIYAAALMVSRTFAGQVYDRHGHRAVFYPGGLLIGTAMLLLSWLPGTWGLWTAAFLYGFGFGMIQPGLQAWAVEKAPKNRKGMANATFFSFFDLGIGIGAMLFGQIGYRYGYPAIYLTAASSVLIAIMLYTLFLWKEGPSFGKTGAGEP